MYGIGLDLESTTIKAVVLDSDGNPLLPMSLSVRNLEFTS